MANSDYSWADVISGVGTYSLAGGTGYSAGVALMQQYLINIGYNITSDGQFGQSTYDAIVEFQRELGLTQDGVVGSATATRINNVRISPYYTNCGARLETSQFGSEIVLAGNLNDIDLIARIIYAEDMNNMEAEKAIGLVIKRRSTNSDLVENISLYPNASIYARTIGFNGAYQPVMESSNNARKPMRGYRGGASDGFVDPYWKNAVDIATKIVNEEFFFFRGFKVIGKTITDIPMEVSSMTTVNYYNQAAWSLYEDWFDANSVDPNVVPVTFSGGTVICKIN